MPIVSGEAAQPVDTKAQTRFCVDAFKLRIAGVTELADEERDTAMRDAFQDCGSASMDPTTYTVLIIRYMVELGCNPAPVLQQYLTSRFAVPPIQSAEWYDLLMLLEMLRAEFSRCVPHVREIHKRLAESLLSAFATTPNSQSHNRDLLLFVRQLWQSAHLRGTKFESSTVHLLRSVTRYIKGRSCKRSFSAILGNLAQDAHRIPAIVGEVEKDQSRLPTAVDVLSCLPKERLLGYIPAATWVIARAAITPGNKSTSQTPLRMHIWLEILRQLESGRALPPTPLVDEALASLTRYALNRKKKSEGGIRILLSALISKVSQTDTFRNVSMQSILDLILSFETATGTSGPIAVDTAFDVLLSHFKKQDLPQEPLAQTLLDLVVHHAGLEFTVPFLHVLDQRRLNLPDPASVHRLIKKEMATVIFRSRKTESARQRNAFILHTCQAVSELLDSISSVSFTRTWKLELDTLQAQRQLAHILTRADVNHALPLAYRNIAASLSVRDSVHLIHQLAHQYSTDNTRTQREAWRATYYLYKFLKQNSLPIEPMFSKAVVRLSVIRPMLEKRFVSARRLIWVRHLVSRAEGEDTAKQVEALLWQWRGELIKHAKIVYIGVGGDRRDKAHIGTMKKLGLL